MPSTPASLLRVFIAEDSLPIRLRVAAMLDAASMMVVGEAASAAESIRGIGETHPDVVVLDHQLDGGTGLDVLRAVRATDRHVAFVVFSNNAMPAYRKRYLREGAADFLDKAIEFERLAPAVRDASHRHAH
jgi:DNA-binding NarL/FixJ family response regulator